MYRFVSRLRSIYYHTSYYLPAYLRAAANAKAKGVSEVERSKDPKRSSSSVDGRTVPQSLGLSVSIVSVCPSNTPRGTDGREKEKRVKAKRGNERDSKAGEIRARSTRLHFSLRISARSEEYFDDRRRRWSPPPTVILPRVS